MIPKKVNVAGVEYEIREVKSLIYDHSLAGQIVFPKGIIKIDSDMSETRKEQTFIHELFHAVMDAAGYEEQEEEMVTRVSNILYQVLKDNKIQFNE